MTTGMCCIHVSSNYLYAYEHARDDEDSVNVLCHPGGYVYFLCGNIFKKAIFYCTLGRGGAKSVSSCDICANRCSLGLSFFWFNEMISSFVLYILYIYKTCALLWKMKICTKKSDV